MAAPLTRKTAMAEVAEPEDAAERRAIKPVIAYAGVPKVDPVLYRRVREGMTKVKEILVPPSDAMTFEVPAGHLFRIVCVQGSQVGDLNLWNRNDLRERFYASKTRQLHATHLTVGDRMWSCMPFMRPMATITHDTLAWYGWDEDGASLHDVLGSRCDPYTNYVLKGENFHKCCHSNLVRSLVEHGVKDPEAHVHDVLNVFMCTGITKDTHQYFMKASPVRPGDFLEFFAEIDLLGGLSACPSGDCRGGSGSGSVYPEGHPLLVEVYKPEEGALKGWVGPSPSGYCGGHGLPPSKKRALSALSLNCVPCQPE